MIIYFYKEGDKISIKGENFMIRMLLIVTLYLLLGTMDFVYAQGPADKPSFPAVNWVSKSSTDDVVIQNGSGATLVIEINVINNPHSNATGIDIKNCGATTHIKAGSSGICTTTDATHPVSFSSDNPSDPASGTYQIKQE